MKQDMRSRTSRRASGEIASSSSTDDAVAAPFLFACISREDTRLVSLVHERLTLAHFDAVEFYR